MRLFQLQEAKYHGSTKYFSVTVGAIPGRRYGYIIEFLVAANTPDEAKEIVKPNFPGAEFDVEPINDEYLTDFGYADFEEFAQSLPDGEQVPEYGQATYVMSGT